MLRTARILVLALLVPGAARAQAPEALVGGPVRATYRTAPDARPVTVEGTWLGVGPDALRLSLDAADEPTLEVPLDRLIRLEVEGGRTAGRGAARGALWGGISGAVLGVVVVSMCAANNGAFIQCGARDVLVGTLVFGGMGAGAGAGLGAAIGARGWREVPVPAADR